MTEASIRSTRPTRLPQGSQSANQRDRTSRTAVGDGPNRGLLRVEEAAEWLGLSRTKAYQLVYRGTLPSVTIGRSRRVPVVELHAFVQRLMETGGAM